MVIPYFSFSTQKMWKTAEKMQKIFTPITGKPNASKDKFWYVDRKFFDRSGWEELIELDNSNKSRIKKGNKMRKLKLIILIYMILLQLIL